MQELINFQLYGGARSLSVELDELLGQLGKEESSYTKQAYSQARMKIRHEGYIEINNKLLEECYNERHKLFKGYRLLGVDGSGIELPYGEEVRKEFGKLNKEERSINYSISLVVYDLLNEMTIDATLNKSTSSEREIAIERLAAIKKEKKQQKDIIVADRGYPSQELFAELIMMGYDFVIRYTGNAFIKETREFAKNKENETIIEMRIEECQKRTGSKAIWDSLREKGIESIKMRLVKFRLKNGQMEYIATSLTDSKEITKGDIKKIYNLRWKEEGYFKFIKHTLECENFSGRVPETIRQDYYSRIVVGNLHSMMTKEAQELLNKEVKKNKKLKYKEYKTNKNVTYGLFRNRIFGLMEKENTKWEAEYDELIRKMALHKIAVIPGRSFPRKTLGSLKYPTNYRSAQ